MKRFKFILVLFLLLLIGFIFIIYKYDIYFTTSNNIESVMEQRLGSNYPNLLNYQYYKIGDEKIIFTDMYKDQHIKLDDINTKNELSVMQNIITYVSKYPYNYGQNNPKYAKSLGLDCQGYSLMIKDFCDEYKIPCYIVHTSNHMYNIVTINNIKYRVDISKGIFEKINGGN